MKTVKPLVFFIKKYGLFLCVPLFLFIAFSMVSSSLPKYKATAKIVLRGISAQSAAEDIKSKYLVQKVLDQLHFQVNYYDSLRLDKEIYNDTMPVRVVLNHGDNIKGEATLVVKVTGNDSFDLTHADTVLSHKFNEPIDEYYGTFSVTRSPGYKYRDSSYLFRLNDPKTLVDQYYNAINAETTGDSILTISVETGNPKKSAAFLDKLLQVYENKYVRLSYKRPNDQLKQANQQMFVLVRKATVIKSEIKKLSTANAKPEQPTHVLADKQQLKIYHAIKPYIEAPVRKFVQVPYTDKIKDVRVRLMLKQYNKLEQKKRHLSVNRRHREAARQIDNALSAQRNELITALYSNNKSKAVKTDTRKTTDSLKALKASLTQIRSNIKVVKTRLAANRPPQAPARAGVSLLKSPHQGIQLISVNRFLVYALALIAGLLIPILWLFFGKPGPDLSSNVFKTGKHFGDWFTERQID